MLLNRRLKAEHLELYRFLSPRNSIVNGRYLTLNVLSLYSHKIENDILHENYLTASRNMKGGHRLHILSPTRDEPCAIYVGIAQSVKLNIGVKSNKNNINDWIGSTLDYNNYSCYLLA